MIIAYVFVVRLYTSISVHRRQLPAQVSRLMSSASDFPHERRENSHLEKFRQDFWRSQMQNFHRRADFTSSAHIATMILRNPARPQLLRTLRQQQVRHATLLRRPKRPYTFTQLVTLSDGSTFLQRTTSPAPVVRSTKDVRNSAMWNPSSQKLLNVEEDEAGRLARFRERFGRGWDAEATSQQEQVRNYRDAWV